METCLGDLVVHLCSNAESLVIAAPYVKADALSRVLAAVSSDASVICVTRWQPHDLAVGASDTECRNLVVGFGGSFQLHPSLHAKYFRIDDVILIGSANLTASAMGWSSHPNLEILCRASDEFDWCAFQQNLLNDAREIDDNEFQRWDTISKIASTNKHDITSGYGIPQLNTWRPRTRDPVHLELSYRGREDDIASFDEQDAAQRDLQVLLMPPGLTNEEVRNWATGCLLAAPFTNTVIQLSHATDIPSSVQLLASTYGLNMTQARRDMETVQNWLALLAPETLTKNFR